MVEEDLAAGLTRIRCNLSDLLDDGPGLPPDQLLPAVLLLPVQVEFRRAPENHVTGATAQELLLGFLPFTYFSVNLCSPLLLVTRSFGVQLLLSMLVMKMLQQRSFCTEGPRTEPAHADGTTAGPQGI